MKPSQELIAHRRYHSRVRRWFLLLLIALLPIRGWVGDAMAGQMIGQHIAATSIATVAVANQGASLPGHDGCAGHSMAATPAPAEAPATDINADCGTCTSCQVCHSVVLAPPSVDSGISLVQHRVAAPRGMRFASAEPARGFKPPIS